jgi:drug/metabolite transporter (DMT)-like permease
MTLSTFGLILVSQCCLVAGQLLIKHAMNLTHHVPKPWRPIIGFFATGLGIMTFCFFLWLGFLQRLDLSHVFPFEGLSPVILLLGASILLGEKIEPRSWFGVTLIALGVALVSLS